MDHDDPRHGTTAGHMQHRRDGEKACRPCQEAANAASYARTYGEDDVPLTGGQWVNVRGIMRWQPDRLVHTLTDRGPVVCDCGARATETCRTENGNRTKPHSYRTSPQVCPCGEPLAWKCRVCPACRDRLDEDRKKAWKNGTSNGLGKTHRRSPLSLIAGTMDSEGTDKKSAPERRANAIAQGPRRPVRKEPTDSWTA